MRSFAAITKLLSIIILMFSVTWVVPIGVSYALGDLYHPFVRSGIITSLFGLGLFLISHRTCQQLRRNDGFIIVAMAWIILSLCAALPFWFSESHFSIIDGLFEAVSGFTTTGAEVIPDLEVMPKCLLFYHQWLQFLGGLGIIILGMALIPMLQSSGPSDWLLSEISSANQDLRITPMLHHTARALWGLYVAFSVLCFVGYCLAGLPWFEALCYTFSTVSTGGFGIHNDNLGHYHLPWVPIVACIFMTLGSINFALHYRVARYKSFQAYLQSQELRLYAVLFMVLLLLVGLKTLFEQITPMEAFFTTLSMLSTTGLQWTEFGNWPGATPYLLMIAAMIGGCCGSTSGGLKVARVWVLVQEARRALFTYTHPSAITDLHLEGLSISETQLSAIRGFLSLFFITYALLTLGFMYLGYDLHTAFAAISACLCNVGLTIHPLADGYGALSTQAKSLLIFTMLTGRLEILTLFILFTPSFWTDKAMT